MDDETAVDRHEPIADRDVMGVGVAAQSGQCFVERDLGVALQDPGRRKPGYSGADDRDRSPRRPGHDVALDAVVRARRGSGKKPLVSSMYCP